VVSRMDGAVGSIGTRRSPLTSLEGASYLRIGRAMIYELLRRGEISSVKFGRLIRVPKVAFESPKPKAESRPFSSRAL
jgi:excisionase family DNA binding protein